MKFEDGVGFQFEGSLSDIGTAKKILETPTTQCGHCGAHFTLPRFDRVGTGKLRGFHMKCGKWICGPNCPGVCGGQFRLLDILEGLTNPTAVSVSVPRSLILPSS